MEINNQLLKEYNFPENARIIETIKNLNPYTDKFPNKCGIYMFTFENKKPYVGSSTSVKRRLSQYINGKGGVPYIILENGILVNKYKETIQEEIKTVDIYITTDEICARFLEILIANKLKLSQNTVCGYDIDYNLRRSLDKYKELGYETEQLKKTLESVGVPFDLPFKSNHIEVTTDDNEFDSMFGV